MKASTFYAFLGGALLGAGVALLLAPDSGTKTRKKLKRKMKKYGKGLNPDELKALIGRLKLDHAKAKIEDIF